MATNEPDIKADIDRHEPLSLMEPLLVPPESRFRRELDDLAVELAGRAAGFSRSLPKGFSRSLAPLVRSMNCYYSNLIEGHDTHPIDIEKALKKDYSGDLCRRNLQLEAEAHIAVQVWLDDGNLAGRVYTAEGVKEIHRRFGQHLPEELLRVADPESGEQLRVVPGAFRERDVQVGRHVPVSPGAIPRFMARFEDVYGRLGRLETIIGAAAAHHRLLWIHPFTDGNGRVARLLSHGVLLGAFDHGGIWSVARGLARNVETYKSLLANCDLPRRNALDGRGNLSEEALAEFCRFFLKTCLDQIDFMESLVQPERLRHRVLAWVREETAAGALPPKSELLLAPLLLHGELPRSAVPNLLGVGERQARRVVSALIDRAVLTSKSSRAPLFLAFPARLASRWLPGLFPDKHYSAQG